MRSGVAASCSFPLFFHAQELLAKDAHGNIRRCVVVLMFYDVCRGLCSASDVELNMCR